MLEDVSRSKHTIDEQDEECSGGERALGYTSID